MVSLDASIQGEFGWFIRGNRSPRNFKSRFIRAKRCLGSIPRPTVGLEHPYEINLDSILQGSFASGATPIPQRNLSLYTGINTATTKKVIYEGIN